MTNVTQLLILYIEIDGIRCYDIHIYIMVSWGSKVRNVL